MSKYEKIKELCKERGITITNLEKELGFARGSLSKIDKNQPSFERLQKLSSYFGMPTEYFSSEDMLEDVKKYYKDRESERIAHEMFEDPDMRALFHMKKNMDSEKFNAHFRMMKELYRLEHPEEEDFY